MRIMVVPCDGIGPEITAATMEVVEATTRAFDLGLTFEEEETGFVSLEKYGTTLRPETIERARTFDGVILGPQSHMDYPSRDKGGINVSAGFRTGLDLYANVRPARVRSFLPARVPSMDIVIMREATEGFYPDRNMFKGIGEFMPTPDVALAVRKITRQGSTRIAETAFKLAMQRPRKKVTAVHKANVLRVTDGLFLECVRAVQKNYPQVEYEEQIMDAMAALLVRDASRFDVILATNAFGDILSDEASEISGSLGLAASINAGSEHALAQAQHGSAPDIAGKDVANPASLIGSVAMLLAWLGERRGDERFIKAADIIERALDQAVAKPETRTRDLGGKLGTKAFGEQVAAAVVGLAK